MPMNLRCMICKCTRRSLSAATQLVYTILTAASTNWEYTAGAACRSPTRRVRSAECRCIPIRDPIRLRKKGRAAVLSLIKSPSGFFAKLLPETQNQFLYHDFAILPLQRGDGTRKDGRAAVLCLFTASILLGPPAYCRYRERNAHAARRLSPSGPSGRPCRGAARRGPCRPRRHPAPRRGWHSAS